MCVDTVDGGVEQASAGQGRIADESILGGFMHMATTSTQKDL